MEIRVLRYFLEIAREGNMTRAAETLHISQPSLSKEMKALEEELGQKLFQRNRSGLKLTDAGMLLRQRTEDILEMVDKTSAEFGTFGEINGGDIHIGCAESENICHLARVIGAFREKYPMLRYHLSSGNTEQVAEKLDKGLLDLAFIVEPPDLSKYNYIEIPAADVWGVVMRRDSPLALKKSVCPDDLCGLPLICSEQAMRAGAVKRRICSIFRERSIFVTTARYSLKRGLAICSHLTVLSIQARTADYVFVRLNRGSKQRCLLYGRNIRCLRLLRSCCLRI